VNGINLTEMEPIVTRSGLKLQVETRQVEQQLELMLRTGGTSGCVLHWGLRHRSEPEWRLPPPSLWPEGTKPFGPSAAQTPFTEHAGKSQILLRFNPVDYSSLELRSSIRPKTVGQQRGKNTNSNRRWRTLSHAKGPAPIAEIGSALLRGKWGTIPGR